ncbi:MAG: ArsR family transcriptional regulator [Cellvibrio sp.]|jgi:predicted transcriptional regulator|nr:ArsR family transcriptional regulator [Cellvibrio sp.]
MKVNNPLTIIAIFAGLAEVLATIALVALPLQIQSTFVYFVIFFPTLLISLFFLVLVFRPKVLYAPSDFENQDHYLEVNEIKNSIDEGLDEIFNNVNKSAQVLSPEEIGRYKSNIKSKIEKAAPTTRREEILEFLSNGEASTKSIFTALEMHHQYALRILRSLAEEGLVERYKKDGALNTIWKLKL